MFLTVSKDIVLVTRVSLAEVVQVPGGWGLPAERGRGGQVIQGPGDEARAESGQTQHLGVIIRELEDNIKTHSSVLTHTDTSLHKFIVRNFKLLQFAELFDDLASLSSIKNVFVS